MQHSLIDLHCHSSQSDGELSPAELVIRAKSNGVRVLALTDHDTVSGVAEAHDVAEKEGVHLITGIELSCEWRGYTIHILGLNFSMEEGSSIHEAQRIQLAARKDRAKEIALKLEKKGMPNVYEQAVGLAVGGVPGRPHFAQALVDAGGVASQAEAFKKYLGSGKVGDVKSQWPSLSQVVRWIHDASGTAIIAHPRKYNMSLTKLRELIVEFKELGGEGIEVVVSGQKQGEIGMLADLCQRFEMQASLGSDFHSPRFPWADLGRIPKLPKSLTPVWAKWKEIPVDN